MNLKDRLPSGKKGSVPETMIPSTIDTAKKSNPPSQESMLQKQSSIIQKQQTEIQTLSTEIMTLRSSLQEKNRVINSQDGRFREMDRYAQELQTKLDRLTVERDALKARGKVDELKTIQDLLSRSAGLKKNLLKKDEVISSLTRQIEMMSDEELLQKEYAQLKMENEFLKQDAQSARDKALAVKSAYEKELAELQVQIDVIAEKEAEVQRLYETESLHIDTLADIKASHMKASLQKKYENVINAQKLSHRNQLIKQQQKYLNIIKFLFAQTLGITVVIVLIIWLPDELNFMFLLCLIIFLIIQALYIRIHKYTLFSKYPRQ